MTFLHNLAHYANFHTYKILLKVAAYIFYHDVLGSVEAFLRVAKLATHCLHIPSPHLPTVASPDLKQLWLKILIKLLTFHHLYSLETNNNGTVKSMVHVSFDS